MIDKGLLYTPSKSLGLPQSDSRLMFHVWFKNTEMVLTKVMWKHSVST